METALIFDTHAHYDDGQFDADRDELLAALPEQGVGWVLNPGCDLDSSRAAVALAARWPHVWAAVGVHPEDCGGWTDADLDALRALAGAEKAVAVGEIGLDYHWEDNPPRDLQRRAFRAQLALARELDRPVIVHDRDAHGDCLALVRECPGLRGVFHCYSGSVEMARELVSLGWYLGFDGPVTYKNAKKALAVAAEIPLERMLLETDAPYLAPVPRRGKRNDSRNLRYVAEALAAVRGIPPDELIRVTRENGFRLFGIAGKE